MNPGVMFLLFNIIGAHLVLYARDYELKLA